MKDRIYYLYHRILEIYLQNPFTYSIKFIFIFRMDIFRINE